MVLPVVQVADLTLLHTSEGEPGGLRKHLAVVGGAQAEQICVVWQCPTLLELTVLQSTLCQVPFCIQLSVPAKKRNK